MQRQQQIPQDCNCCPQCKFRILKLEQMVEELYSLMSDYLPDQTLKLASLPPNQIYLRPQSPPPILIAQPQTQEQIPIKLSGASIIKPNNPPVPQVQRQQVVKKKKQYNDQQKRSIISAIQVRLKAGKTILQACSDFGINDRTYTRWKKSLQQEYFDNRSIYQQQDHIVINNYKQ